MPFTLLLFLGHDSEIEMTDAAQLLARAIERFDEVNARDPRTTPVGEREGPTELVYARRMTVTLDRFAPRGIRRASLGRPRAAHLQVEHSAL